MASEEIPGARECEAYCIRLSELQYNCCKLREVQLLKLVELANRKETELGILKRKIEQAQPVILGGSGGGDGGAAD